MKRLISFCLSLAVLTCFGVSAFAAEAITSAAPEKYMIDIETSYFFNDVIGTYYIYFGCPTCLECTEFEPYLLDALENNNQVVYYYNTSYWKDDPRYDSVISEYHVYSVPLLVKMVDGEYRGTYQFDPDASAEETKMQLDDFFIKKSTLFPVTGERNFPIQFHDYLFTLTFFMMCTNVCYLILKQKDLAASGRKSPLGWIAVNSTLLFALHIAIAGFGFGFAMQYEASPPSDLVAKIGKYTWLTVTPILYFIILGLAVKIILKQDVAKRDRGISQ